MEKEEIKEVLKILKELNFNIYFDKDFYGKNKSGIEIETYTPAGENWIENFEFDENDINIFIKSLKNRIENWNSDYEAESYINQRGKNGVPNSIRVLLHDADWKYNYLCDLLNKIKGGKNYVRKYN